MSEAMTYKLPPLPETDYMMGGKGYSGSQMQAYAIAAIEAQGVPDGWRETLQNLLFAAQERDKKNRIRQFDDYILAAEKLLASAPPAPQANKTHVLVPLRMTRAMQDVVGEEDWSWADLLAAAEAVTEDEYAIAEKTEPVAPQAEQFCCCNDEISLQMVSGGASSDGLYGRVTLKVSGEFVDYVRAAVVQQEPVAWMRKLFGYERQYCEKPYTTDWTPLYTHPAQQAKQPLTDEQKTKLIESLRRQDGWDGDGWDIAVIEAVERHHGIKGE